MNEFNETKLDTLSDVKEKLFDLVFGKYDRHVFNFTNAQIILTRRTNSIALYQELPIGHISEQFAINQLPNLWKVLVKLLNDNKEVEEGAA